MIDEYELLALRDRQERDPEARPDLPPLDTVVTRGRMLRRRRRFAQATTAALAAVLVMGVVQAFPEPSRDINMASEPGGDNPAPEFGADDPAPSGQYQGPDSTPPVPTDKTVDGGAPPVSDPKGEAEPGGGKSDPGVLPDPGSKPDPGETPDKDLPPHSTVPTTDGALANLVVAGLSPAFDPGVTAYTAPAGEHDRTTVTATLSDPGANLYIQSTPVVSGEPFHAWVGDGKHVDIVIYSDWTEIGRYVITLPGQAPPPPPAPHSTVKTTDGKLAGLLVDGLSPAFDPDTHTYTAPALDHDKLIVTATLSDPNANLYIQSTKVNSGQPFNAWVGDGKSVDIVIYSDWTEIGRYTITRPN